MVVSSQHFPLTRSSILEIVLSGTFMLIGAHRHLMTGTGAYFYIVWGIWLRHCLNGKQEEYDLQWPRLFSVPEVVRTGKVKNRSVTHNDKKIR